MTFFDLFFLLLAAALLILGCRPQHLRDVARYRSALNFFVWALIIAYDVPAFIRITVVLGISTVPIGMIVGVLSFRHLCLALFNPANTEECQLKAPPQE